MRHPFYRRKIHITRRLMNLPRPIKLLSFIMFIYYLGWAISDPYIAIYFKEKLGTYTRLGIVYAAFPFFSIIWVLLTGLIIDNNSKKKLINLSMFLYTPLSFIILSISKFFHFILYRLYHSLIASILWLSVESYLREHSPKNRASEARGLFDSAYGSTLIIGPLIGALLITKLGFNLFYSISIFAFLAFLFSLMLVDKKNSISFKIKYSSLKKEFYDFWVNKKLARTGLFLGMLTFCLSFTGLLLPLFLREFGASYLQIGIVYALYNIPILFEAYFSCLKNKKRLLFLGVFFSAIIFLLMFRVTNLYYLFILIFFLGVSVSSLIPTIHGRITNLMPKKEIGELSAMLTAITDFSNTIGILLAGFIADYLGLNYVFLLAFFVFAILLLIITFTKKMELENA